MLSACEGHRSAWNVLVRGTKHNNAINYNRFQKRHLYEKTHSVKWKINEINKNQGYCKSEIGNRRLIVQWTVWRFPKNITRIRYTDIIAFKKIIPKRGFQVAPQESGHPISRRPWVTWARVAEERAVVLLRKEGWRYCLSPPPVTVTPANCGHQWAHHVCEVG